MLSLTLAANTMMAQKYDKIPLKENPVPVTTVKDITGF